MAMCKGLDCHSLQAGQPAVSVCTGGGRLSSQIPSSPQPVSGPQLLKGDAECCSAVW